MSTATRSPIFNRLGLRSEDEPSGPSLEYNALFVAMERAARGRDEQQFGQTVIEAEPPQWMLVQKLATELLQQTHDLRIGVFLAESVIDSEGLPGFTNCLQMLAMWLEEEWDTVHPQLDADDGYDPTLRVNTLTRLTDSRRVLQRLRMIPLTDTRGLGMVTLGDLVTLVETSSADHEINTTTEATLSGGPTDPLITAATSLRNAMMAVMRLDQALCERIGVENSVEFTPLIRIFRLPLSILADRLERRGIRLEKPAAVRSHTSEVLPHQSGLPETVVSENCSVAEPAITIDGTSACDTTALDSLPASLSPRDWQITSRSDVTIALDRLCGYFAQYEPSSPIPLLLARAKRLVPMTFLEILQELGPDVLTQAHRLQGDTN